MNFHLSVSLSNLPKACFRHSQLQTSDLVKTIQTINLLKNIACEKVASLPAFFLQCRLGSDRTDTVLVYKDRKED